MVEIVASCIFFLLAVVLLFMGLRSWQCRGLLLNNAYLHASQKQREQMDKKPYYRQTAVSFWMLSVVFLLDGFATLLQASWISYIVYTFILLTIAYAIVSSVLITRKKK